MKKCRKCGKILEETIEFFYVSKSSKGGLNSRCKSCFNELSKERYLKNRNKILESVKLYRELNKELIATQQSLYYKKNKEAISKYKKEYLEKNKETIHKKAKVYRDDHKEESHQYYADNRDRIIESAKKRNVKNIVRINIVRKIYCNKNKAKIAARRRKYHKNNPEKNRIDCQKRRSRKHLLATTLTIPQWEKIKTLFNNSCAYCGKESLLQQDHFIALSKQGEYSRDNIIPACSRCNGSKNDNNFFKWYPKQAYYSKSRESKILKHLGYRHQKQQLSIF